MGADLAKLAPPGSFADHLQLPSPDSTGAAVDDPGEADLVPQLDALLLCRVCLHGQQMHDKRRTGQPRLQRLMQQEPLHILTGSRCSGADVLPCHACLLTV